MSIQHQRVVELCNELRLGGVAAQYSALAQNAADKHTSFTDFVEELLSRSVSRAGAGPRDVRARRWLPRDQDARSVRLQLRHRAHRASRSWSLRASPSSNALRTSCSSGSRAWAKLTSRSPSGI
jgi:hypothetical protein